MNLICTFRNENVKTPALPKKEKYSWLYVTADFDRTKPFTKVRISCKGAITDWMFSYKPGINVDGSSWSSVNSDTYGWAGTYRTAYYGGFGLAWLANSSATWGPPPSGITGIKLATTGTLVGVGLDGYNQYEFEYPITVYYAGTSSTNNYTNYPYQVQVYTLN